MSVAEAVPETATRLLIDPRSFHVFEFNGERLLFDRATGSTSAVSELAYDVLYQVRRGVSVAEAAIDTASRFEGADPDDIVSTLAELKKTGFFRFHDVSPKTEEDLEYLWTHKPR